MIRISNSKISSLAPVWAPFAGFSLIFDNPGDSTLRERTLAKIGCAPEPGGVLDLYSRLASTIARIGGPRLTEEYLFCPLPVESYHVTVWDGINADNVDRVPPQLAPEWRAFLGNVPFSLSNPPASMSVVTSSPLALQPSGIITFSFAGLSIWASRVLAARLEPIAACKRQFDDLSQARADLCRLARQTFGANTWEDHWDRFTPHISLGYFADPDRVQIGIEKEWEDQFKDDLSSPATSLISFASLTAYAFSDMANFYRVRQ